MKTKKLMQLCFFVLAMLCLSSCSSQGKSMKDSVHNSQVLMNENEVESPAENLITITPVYLKVVYGEEYPYPIYLDLCYPQISGLDSKEDESIINTMLYDIALKSLGDKITVANINNALIEAVENISQTPSLTDLVANITFQTVYCNNNYASFYFTGSTTVAAAAINTFEYLVTIDLRDASYLDLTAYFSLDDILNCIVQENFKVISGQYLPGGWDGPEMKDQFVVAMRRGVDEEYLLKCHAYSTERWNDGASVQCIQKGDTTITYNEYDIYSARNFVLSKEFIYVKFPFADSLDGYVVLEIPLTSQNSQY